MADVNMIELPGNLYNISFGENPAADQLLSMLQLQRDDFGRYRDVFLTRRVQGKQVPWRLFILVYTRIGGGNKPDYQHVFRRMGMHKQIIFAWDDEYDATYHYIQFEVPEVFMNEAEKLFKAQGGEPQLIRAKFEALQKEMESMTKEQMEADPRFAPITKAFKDMLG